MTKTKITLSIALMFAMTSALPGCHRDANLTEQERIQRAQDFEAKGNLKGSIVELKNAIEKNPNSPQARLMLGQIYLKAGMGAEAEKELTKAEKLGVSRETIQIQLGEALLLMGEYKRVLNEIQAGSQTSKINLARIQQIHADALLNQGKLKDACSLYQQSMDTDTHNPPTYWGLAKCAIANNDPGKARELLNTALKIKSRQAETWIYVGGLERLNNNMQAALAAYSNALNSDPNNLNALVNRASANLLLDQFEPARKDIDQLRKVAPKSVEASYLQALFAFKQAKYPAARDHLQEVFSITQNHAPSVLLAGTVAYELGSYEQAETYLTRYVAGDPGNSFARRVLAATEIKQNQSDKALEILSPLLTPDSKDAQALSLAGEVCLRIKDYKKAMGYLERASELDPENTTIKTSLAKGHIAEGEANEAITELDQAANVSTKPSEADLGLVLLHLKRKEYDQALQAITSLEKKLPNNPVTQNLRAVALLGKQDQAGGRKALEQALAIKPDFFPAALNLARLDMAENKPDVARNRFEAILRQDKKNVEAMMALADLAALQKNENEYVGWLEQAMKAQPTDARARYALVRYYLAKKENQKALALANEAASSYPDSIEALNLLGATQLANGNRAGAITTFTRITQKVPQSPLALLNLATAQVADSQLSDARHNLQQAIQLSPDFLQAQDALIHLELTDKKPQVALQIARQIQAHQPTSPLGFDREGNIELSQHNFPFAIKAYEQAVAKGAGSTGLIKLHRALILGGETKTADQRLSAWIGQNPKDAAVRRYAAGYYLGNNRNRDAVDQYEALLKLDPNNPFDLNNLATLYQQEQDTRALATAEQAFKLAPENAGVQDTLGWILISQGQTSRALQLLRKAAEKDSKVPTIRYHYAVALAKSGDEAQARRELQDLIGLGQKFPELAEAKAMLQRLPQN